MGIMNTILQNAIQLIRSLGKKTPDTDQNIEQAYQYIENWRAIYGNYPDWATYQTNGLTGKKTVTRKLTSGAKVICAELASLIWSEQPNIHVSDAVNDVLENNNFFEEMQKYVEYFSALGGIAVKGYYDGEIKLDFVTAERFVPLSYTNQEITDAQFIDNRTYNGKKYVRLETYMKTENGYMVTNELFDENNKQVPLAMIPDLAEIESPVEITTDKKLFGYVKYPVANNLDMNSPLGISMFANSTGSLEALDTAYDLLNDELVLGRKRIIVPDSAMQSIFDPERGSMDRFFDTNDRVYQALHFEEAESYKITDNTTSLRVTDILEAIDGHLRMIEFQTGFSQGYFSFDMKSGIKTATEVISDNSQTFKTKQAAENQIDSLIFDTVEIIEAIAEIYKVELATETMSIEWDDSVIEDRNSKAAYWTGLKNSSLATTEMALMGIHGLTEKEAKKMAEDIRAEQNIFISDPLDND